MATLAKRSALIAYDALSALIVALLLSLAFTTPAYAYIDPSVMTYTIQAVAGVAVALSAVAGVALRRGRKHLYRILDIDENAKRVREPDVHRLDDMGNPIMETTASEPAGTPDAASAASLSQEGDSTDATSDAPLKAVPAKKRRQPIFSGKPYKPTRKERLAYGVVVAFFFAFTIYYVAPLEIVAGSSSDLTYSIADVWWVLIPPGLGIVAVITGVLVLLRGRGFSLFLLVVFALGLAAYLQALFLNVGLPAADGATIIWSDHMVMGIVSSFVWVGLLALAVIFGLLFARRAQGVVAILSVALVIVQAVGLASLVIAPPDSDSAPGGKVVMTEDQLFTVNPNHNVVVFVLDTYDTAYLTRVLEMNPKLLDGLTGFTNYENATSAMIPTRFAIPEMLTGQMPSFDESYETYAAERYARSDFLDTIYNADYSIGLYTDSLRISTLSREEQYGITSKTVNMHDLPNSMMDYSGTLYSLYQMGQYRDAPWPFKWAFWYYTDEINRSMVAGGTDTAPDETVYTMDDIRYYNRLRQFGLSLEEGNHAGAFRFIHLLGSHYPFNYDEYVNDLGTDNSNVFKQSQGAIHIVTEYINQLKELGVYENTTIIITADHGYWTITLDPIEETSTPIMFVKPEQSAELDAQPIKVDEKPVSHLDLQATVLDAMGKDWSEYSSRDEWAGYSMFGEIDPDRVRYYLTTDSEPDLTAVAFREYMIDGNALIWSNWHETGRFIEPIEQS